MVPALSDFHLHFAGRFPSLVGRELLVALSGGADSVALLHLLRHPDLRLDLQAAHVHHGVRGAEADSDASFCLDTCRDLGIACHVSRLEPGLPTPAGREGTWRAQRYAHLQALATDLRLPAIATGHHRDDVSEGVLMQMLRGAGPRALAGIEAETSSGIIRPLLPWRRMEIRNWLEEQEITWREDGSNQDLAHLRNRVRHQLMPQLEEVAPSFREHLVSLAGALAADENYLADQLSQRASWIDPWHPFGGVPLNAVADLPSALRTRWLHAQVARLGIGSATRKQVLQLDDLLEGSARRAITLAARWTLRVWRRMLWLEPPQIPDIRFSILLEDHVERALPLPAWSIRKRSTDSEKGHATEWTWSPQSPGKVTVSDPITASAFEGHESQAWLRKLLAELLPRHLRSTWPVFRVDDTIGWVPGVWQHPDSGTYSSVSLEVARRWPT